MTFKKHKYQLSLFNVSYWYIFILILGPLFSLYILTGNNLSQINNSQINSYSLGLSLSSRSLYPIAQMMSPLGYLKDTSYSMCHLIIIPPNTGFSSSAHIHPLCHLSFSFLIAEVFFFKCKVLNKPFLVFRNISSTSYSILCFFSPMSEISSLN